MKYSNTTDSLKYIKKYLYKIIKVNVVFDAEDRDYVTIATCINEQGVVETISIEGFEIQSDIDDLQGCFIEIDECEDEDFEGFIFKNKSK